jgi:soluble lytic murein transglycosylase-like protein
MWVAGSLVCLVLLAFGVDRTGALRPSAGVHRNAKLPPVTDDTVTDQFLRQFRPLRDNVEQRRTLATEVVAAAAQNRLDPDLLFALVAAESSFDRTAVSRKGARGLGQVMFPTARAVAPALVRRPNDLHDVRKNLAVTARHLQALLTMGGGDLRAALTMYHAGPHNGRLPKHGDDRYVGLICTYYASLKVRRRYGEMAALTAETTERPEG